MDAIHGISGAACRLSEFDAVPSTRVEVAERRNFDLANEFFHMLTWDEMPPKHVQQAGDVGGNRVQQLANNFAATLLMLAAVIETGVDWAQWEQKDLISTLNTTADNSGVTSSALRWRSVDLKKLKPGVARRIPESVLKNISGKSLPDQPPLFSRGFVEVLAEAIYQGYISVRRAAGLVGLVLEDLQQVFSDHGVDCAVEL